MSSIIEIFKAKDFEKLRQLLVDKYSPAPRTVGAYKSRNRMVREELAGNNKAISNIYDTVNPKKYKRYLVLPLEIGEEKDVLSNETFPRQNLVMDNLKKDFHLDLKKRKRKVKFRLGNEYVKNSVKVRPLGFIAKPFIKLPNKIYRLFKADDEKAIAKSFNGTTYRYTQEIDNRDNILKPKLSMQNLFLCIIDDKARIATKLGYGKEKPDLKKDFLSNYKSIIMQSSRFLTDIMVVNNLDGKYALGNDELKAKMIKGITIQLMQKMNNIPANYRIAAFDVVRRISLRASNYLLAKMGLNKYDEDTFEDDYEGNFERLDLNEFKPHEVLASSTPLQLLDGEKAEDDAIEIKDYKEISPETAEEDQSEVKTQPDEGKSGLKEILKLKQELDKIEDKTNSEFEEIFNAFYNKLKEMGQLNDNSEKDALRYILIDGDLNKELENAIKEEIAKEQEAQVAEESTDSDEIGITEEDVAEVTEEVEATDDENINEEFVTEEPKEKDAEEINKARGTTAPEETQEKQESDNVTKTQNQIPDDSESDSSERVEEEDKGAQTVTEEIKEELKTADEKKNQNLKSKDGLECSVIKNGISVKYYSKVLDESNKVNFSITNGMIFRYYRIGSLEEIANKFKEKNIAEGNCKKISKFLRQPKVKQEFMSRMKEAEVKEEARKAAREAKNQSKTKSISLDQGK